MEHFLGTGRARQIQNRVLQLLDKTDLEQAAHLDVYSGVAGLLLSLCQLYQERASDMVLRHLRRAAERLLESRTLEYESLLFWDTSGKGRPLSEAGHGMVGIAAALSKVWSILKDDRCRKAAWDALAFEYGVYSRKIGSWPDLRAAYGEERAMHGICSGAPGMGLALEYCRNNGLEPPWLTEDLKRAKTCCLTHPPLYRDHLCCGNSSAVDFLLTQPDCRDHGGRLLSFMKIRKEKNGGYLYLPNHFRSAPSPDLFSGGSGVGYELLPYAKAGEFRQILF